MSRHIKSLLSAACITVLLAAAATAVAQRDVPPGKPFQALQTQIDQNSAELNLLRARVSSIETQLAALQQEASGTAALIADLDARVTANRADIQALLSTTASMSASLNGFLLQYASDLQLVNADIAQVNSRVTQLEADLTAATADLQAQLTALQEYGGGDTGALAAQVAALAAQVVLISNTLNDQQQTLVDLEAGRQALIAEVAGLQLRVDALEGRVSILEGFHTPIPQACDTGSDPGTSAPWVVCSADADTAWISADSSGLYHAELICQNLGYSTVSMWSGTCGNVCGFCQGPTSCSNPGMGPEIEGRSWSTFNGGTSELGPRIGQTVQWECVK
jgi:hypothetical protein